MALDYHKELIGAIEDYLRNNKNFVNRQSVRSGVDTRRGLTKIIKYAKSRRKTLLQFEKEVKLARLSTKE